MASFDEHCNDCERILGDRCEAVNRWVDSGFAKFGANHRFLKHHWRGVDEAGKLFGELGRKAAIVHIVKDCGRVPKVREWEDKLPNTLLITPSDGLMAAFSSVEEFEKMVLSHLKLDDVMQRGQAQRFNFRVGAQ